MTLWRDLKLSVTPLAHLCENYIIFQMINIIAGLANKSDDYIERDHQDGMKISRIYADITDFL